MTDNGWEGQEFEKGKKFVLFFGKQFSAENGEFFLLYKKISNLSGCEEGSENVDSYNISYDDFLSAVISFKSYCENIGFN